MRISERIKSLNWEMDYLSKYYGIRNQNPEFFTLLNLLYTQEPWKTPVFKDDLKRQIVYQCIILSDKSYLKDDLIDFAD